MSEDKRFYWIKLRTDFFSDDSPMDILLSQKNGSEYVCLYIKLCLATANKQGRLCNEIGEIIIPYDVEKIQRDMKYFSIDTVRVALELYQKLGLIYEESDGVLAIAKHDEMVGSESKWAKYKRDERIGKSLDNVQQRLEIRDKEIRDKEKDIYTPIIESFNSICVSLPKARLTDKRKKKIKTRLKDYTADDFEKTFHLVEESDFLSGRSGAWKASIDWLLEEANMVKVLEGNYANKGTSKKQNAFIANNQRAYDYEAIERMKTGG